MDISRDEARALLGLLGITEPEELDCEEFLRRTPAVLERLKAHDTSEIEGHRRFLHHLEICQECSEEFEALCAALREGLL